MMTLCLALLALLAQEAVTAAGPLDRVRPQDKPPAGAVASIQAARNEVESFQVVVRAGVEPLKGVTAEAGDLKGPGVLPRRHIALFREHYIEVKKPSPKSKDGAGWYPDALVPLAAPFDVPARSNQPLWMDVAVPKDAPPGEYTGTVTVSAAGRRLGAVEVRLTVWDFALPDVPSFRSNFGGLGGRVAKGHKTDPNAPEFRALERRYAEAMAAHRLSPPIPGYLYPRAKPDGSVDPSETHAALKEWIETLHVNGILLRLQGKDPAGQDRERNVRHLQSMWTYLKENGWEKMAYIYVLDEPNDAAAYEQVRRRAKLIHEAQPGIKILCTEQPTPSKPEWGTLVGSVDLWVPLWPLFEEKSGAERLAAGEELWSYTALCQGGKGRDTPFWQLDFPLLNYRVPAWTSWRYGMKGILYWTTVFWEKPEEIWTNPLTYKDAYNTEGALFYPGPEGPVASMRLKALRDGMEDYEYFRLLAERHGPEKALAKVMEVARSWTDWDADPAALLRARAAIAREIAATK